MPEYTPNKNYALPYESEPVDINVLNDNFRKDDGFPFVVESGTTTAKRYAPGSTSTVAETPDWYYRKWSDGLLEAWCMSHVTGLTIDADEYDGTWRSKYVRFDYPALGQQKIINRNATVTGADDYSVGYWVQDSSVPKAGGDHALYQTVRVLSVNKQSTARDKNFYVSFVATWK